MKIKTSELSGEALAWAVARSLKLRISIFKSHSGGQCWPIVDGVLYDPLMDRKICGWVLLNEHCTAFHRDPDGTCWATVGMSKCSGSDILEAFCRALVTERIGKEVDVPDELVLE